MRYFHPKKWYRITKTNVIEFFLNYCLPDKTYLKYRYRQVFGVKLDLRSPKTINEKMQWLKLYDRNPAYPRMTDKYEAKIYIASIVGEEFIIPTLGIWNNFDDIDFDKLPNQFVLKCTHDSGSVVICTDKAKFDKLAARKKISAALRQNYYRYTNRQWVYKDIKTRVIAEKFLLSSTGVIMEYQIFCNNGIPQFFLVRNDLGINKNNTESFAISYTMDWKRVAYRIGEEKSMNIQLEKPKNFDKMIEFARLLSYNKLHLRVDFYEVDEKLYIGELTFCTNGGFFTNYNQTAIDILSKSLTLPKSI